MLGKYCVGRFILTAGIINALFIGSALAFQHSQPSENTVTYENDTQVKPTRNSWSRGGSQQEVANNRKPDTAITTKKGTWSRGGVLHDAGKKERALVNK
ncbi:hypothetical protein BPIT_14730 [Candidatus Brocadia pituitae]|nr:hypothetical protein BPIT_14730 [Candidatus Brocadia pituitae]